MYAQALEHTTCPIHMQTQILIKQMTSSGRCKSLKLMYLSIIYSWGLSSHCAVEQLEDTDVQTQILDTAQRVNKCIPGIKGHVSRESVRGRLAEKEADAVVEAVSVCAGGRMRCGEGKRALLQQGQRVGWTLAQGVRATAQLLAAIGIYAVQQAIWNAQEVKNVQKRRATDAKRHTFSNKHHRWGGLEGSWIYYFTLECIINTGFNICKWL